MFLNLNWRKAGGIWGDGQWLKISDELIVSIGGAFKSGNTLKNDDFTQAPINVSFPCLVHVYRGPFDSESLDQWAQDDGQFDAPQRAGYVNMTGDDYWGHHSEHLFKNVFGALTFVESLKDGVQ